MEIKDEECWDMESYVVGVRVIRAHFGMVVETCHLMKKASRLKILVLGF